jgi:hypothetical protein
MVGLERGSLKFLVGEPRSQRRLEKGLVAEEGPRAYSSAMRAPESRDEL